jgi:hypothetical protein
MKDDTSPKAPPAGRLAGEVICGTCVLGMIALAWRSLSAVVGHTYFLSDQVDQLQQLDLVLRGYSAGLYGPWWSGTAPLVQGLGPLSGLAFGIPARLGLDPDQIHVVFIWSLLGSAAGFYAFTRRLDPWLALLWTSLILASFTFWWAASLLWTNSLLVPLGLLFAAGVVAYARRPDANTAMWLLLLVWLGWHIHSTPGIMFLLVIAIAWDVWRRWRAGAVRLRASWQTLLGLVLVVGPYVVAEALTRGRNTRAIVANLVRRGPREGAVRGARESVEGALRLLGVPLFPHDGPTWSRIVGWAVVTALLATWLVLCGRALPRLRRGREVPEDRLALAALLVLVGQTAFFVAVNRGILSWHYLLYGLPWMTLAAALAVRHLAARLGPAAPILMVALSVAVFAHGFWRADGWYETTDWNFRNMRSGMARACADHPRIRLSEAGGFAAYHPAMESVLEYLAHRWVPACRIQADAPVLVQPDRAGAFPEALRAQGLDWRRIEVIRPGLGIYLRAPGPEAGRAP